MSEKAGVASGIAVTKQAFRFKSSVAVLVLLVSGSSIGAQATDTAPPKELLQYVEQARREGARDNKIKQEAVQAGWPAGVVDQALAYNKTGKGAKAASSGSGSAA